MAGKFTTTKKLALLICFFLLLTACAPRQQSNTNQPLILKTSGQECQQDAACQSKVCNFIKENFGQCAPAQCSTSEQAIGIDGQITFYCDHNNHWQKMRQFGESCNYDYECVKLTCKDNPVCHPGDFKYYCKNHECVAEQQPDACELQGLKRITQKDEYLDKDKCIESIAQREIQTVCAPCGNGKCDMDLENDCNCPADCPKNETLKILSDQELIDYYNSDFDKEEMMFKDFILGTYTGVPVRVSFPCSDVCPNYTVRIIKYDRSVEDCPSIKGTIKEFNVPFGIGVKQEKICLPSIIANISNK